MKARVVRQSSCQPARQANASAGRGPRKSTYLPFAQRIVLPGKRNTGSPDLSSMRRPLAVAKRRAQRAALVCAWCLERRRCCGLEADARTYE